MHEVKEEVGLEEEEEKTSGELASIAEDQDLNSQRQVATEGTGTDQQN